MKEKDCPLCETKLETRMVTPCMSCGSDKSELDHYEAHIYCEYELYFGQRLILCNFCDVDFSSYNPTHFGFDSGKRLGLTDFAFVRDISDKSLLLDQYCPTCNLRLPFLNFIKNL